MVETFLVVFGSAQHAKDFCFELHRRLRNVSSFRDDCCVLVYDASMYGQREHILRLARSSSASHVRAVVPKGIPK